MELWDAYFSNGEPAGRDLVRGEPVPKGLYHMTCEMLVRHVDGDYLVTRRDLKKPAFPGYWEAGAAGSIQKGETPYAGALRELREETGIEAGELTLVRMQSNLIDTFYYGFLCVTDVAKDSVLLQPGETIDYRWLSPKDFADFLYSPTFVPQVRERWLPYLKQSGRLESART